MDCIFIVLFHSLWQYKTHLPIHTHTHIQLFLVYIELQAAGCFFLFFNPHLWSWDLGSDWKTENVVIRSWNEFPLWLASALGIGWGLWECRLGELSERRLGFPTGPPWPDLGWAEEKLWKEEHAFTCIWGNLRLSVLPKDTLTYY